MDRAYSNVAVSRCQLERVLERKGALVFDPELPHVRSQRYLFSIAYPAIINEFSTFLKQNEAAVRGLEEKYRVEDGIKPPL